MIYLISKKLVYNKSTKISRYKYNVVKVTNKRLSVSEIYSTGYYIYNEKNNSAYKRNLISLNENETSNVINVVNNYKIEKRLNKLNKICFT